MKTALGIPYAGDPPKEACPSHHALAVEIGRMGEIVLIHPLDQIPHSKARNYIMEHALREECDLLMFVDADNIIPTGAFETLLETLEKTGAVMVSGYYLQRGFPFGPVWFKWFEDRQCAGQVQPREGITSPQRIDICGLGCALVRLGWVRENIEKPWFRIMEREDGKMVWEDTYFCLKIRERGGLVVGDPRVVSDHLFKREVINAQTVERLRKDAFS